MRLTDRHNLTPQQLLRASILCMVLAFIFLTLLVSKAFGQERPHDTPMKVTIATYAGLATVDLLQTTPCVRSGACRERNAVLKPVAGSYAGMAAAKAAGVTVFSTVAWKLRKEHPKVAWTMLGTVTALQGAVVVYNARQVHR